MKNNLAMTKLTACVILCIIGVLIPLYSPLKIVMEPASFTVASYVPILLAMFISPMAALVVSIGTTAGFLMAGSPVVIVLRAATHLTFAQFGALYLVERPQTLTKRSDSLIFSLLVALLRAICEMMVVIPFYFGHGMSDSYYALGFLKTVVLLVGVGTFIHSIVDFEISLLIWKPLKKIISQPQMYRGE